MAEKRLPTLAEALSAKNRIEFGGDAHKALIEQGYGMTFAKARAIIEERKKNPAAYPYELLEKAEAMLAQLDSVPRPISTDKGWHRDRIRTDSGYEERDEE